MSFSPSVSRVLKQYGTSYTLRTEAAVSGGNSWTASPGAVTYSVVIAKERGFKPNEIRGGIQEGDGLIVVDASADAPIPRVGSRIALGVFSSDVAADWRQIVNVYPTRENGRARTYRLQVRR